MNKIFLIASILALALTAPASAATTPPPAKTTPAPQPTTTLLPITLTPEETAGVITLLGQMPASQSSDLYKFFIAKEQAAQAAKK